MPNEIKVRTKIHEYALLQITARLEIIDGILIAIANIEEIVEIIKSSNDKAMAKKKLIDRFNFTNAQVDAILKMTLSRLINLEIQSFKNEKDKLMAEMNNIKSILNDKNLLYKEIEDGLKYVANKYGDERRTRLMNLNYKGNEEDAEPIEKKELLIHFTNLGNLYTQESTTLMTTRRGGKGTKIKLAKNEAIIQTINDDNFSTLLAFSNKGKMYSINIDDLPINSKINIQQLFNFELGEKITKCTSITRKNETKYFVFITKNGMIKKTSTNEYEHRRGKSLKAINLKDNDEVIDVLFVDNEKVGILTFNGNFVIINTEDINPIGRATSGIKAIKLNTDDYVINSHIIKNNDKLLITVSKNGLIKKTSIDEFDVCNRNIKGRRISETKDNDSIVDFLTLDKESDIIISANKNIIKINTNELRLLSRDAVGVKSITLNDNDYILSILQS